MASKIQRRCAVAPAAAAAGAAALTQLAIIAPSSAAATTQLATVTPSIGACPSTEKDENFTCFPDELIEVEILPRLDVKTLHKFKCVSKRFESIISHLKFGLRYTQKAYSSPESLSSSGLRSTMLLPFTDLSRFVQDDTFSKNVKDLASTGNQDPFPISVNSISLPDIMSHLIIASTNGLVLSRYYDCLRNRMSFTLWVSNPLTKQCIKLPHNGLLTCMAMEYGFASRRDQATDLLTYKVVAIEFPVIKEGMPRHKVVTVHIFSSETGRWAAFEVRLPEKVFCVPYHGFSHEGSLYFFNRRMGFVLTYNPYDSPDRFDRISLPTDSLQTSLVYSEEEDTAVRCWEMIECDDGGGGLVVTVWRLGDAKPWWCFERRFRLPSPARVCLLRMVAPYPWDPDVICHAYLVEKKMAVINQRKGTWESVDVTFGIPCYETPLINIHLSPWSSPFYAQASQRDG